MATFAYLRVSTEGQTEDSQATALRAAGLVFDEVFVDRGECRDSAPESRPGWSSMLEALTPGDEVIVYSLDRLGEGLVQLGARAALEALKVTLRSLNDAEPDDEYAGTVLRYLRAGLAAAERARLRQRTRAGISAARQRNVRLGRPHREIPAAAWILLKEGRSVSEVARLTDVPRRTLADHLRRQGTAESHAAG